MNERLKRILSLDWDAVAGIIAAVAALVMHFLHIIETETLLTIAVALLALLFLRDLRRERVNERVEQEIASTAIAVREIQTTLIPPDALLVGPRQLRSSTEDFCRRAQGEMIWFHVCLLMFKPQSLFDSLLRPAVENPLVTSIQFVLDPKQTELWQTQVLPKLDQCIGKEKVRIPVWTPIDENVSVILADIGLGGKTECLLSFWGEPFMSYQVGYKVPRYIFRVQAHSELITRFSELERKYRMAESQTLLPP